MSRHLRIGAGLLALAVPASLPAATSALAQESDSSYLGIINITGTRTEKPVFESPNSVSVVDRTELDRKAPDSIAEMLRDVPGVDVVDASVAGMKRVRIRGESSRRVTILVDGQEITDHSTYGTPILIDPSIVERIDVIRGPASVLYGSKAIGGVVNIITRKGGEKMIEAETSASYFSATEGYHLSGMVLGKVENVDYRIAGAFAEHRDRDVAGTRYDPSGKLSNSAYETDTLSGHLGFRFGADDNHYIALKAEEYKLESSTWIDPSYLGPQSDGSTTNSFNVDLPERDLQKFALSYDATDLGPVVRRIHFDAYHQTISRLFLNEVNSRSRTGTVSDIHVLSDDLITDVGGTLQVDLQPLPSHYVVTGVQYLSDSLTKVGNTWGSIRPAFPPIVIPIASRTYDEAEVRTFSAFVQDEWSITDYLKLTAGARYYNIESELQASNRFNFAGGKDDRILGSVGVTYSGIADTLLRAHFSQGYVYPTLLQLFVPTSAGGTNIYANPDLRPETSDNFEIGARYDNGRAVLDVTGYYTLAEDYIDSTTCTTCPATYTERWENINKATTYGIEILAEYTFEGWNVTPYVNGNWTRRKFEYTNFSTYNTDVPEYSGRVGARYDWTYRDRVRGWADLFVRAGSASRFTSAAGVTTSEGSWATLNLALGASAGENDKYGLSISLNNLTDASYRPTLDELPGEGRSLEVRATIKLN